jgi:hypothetical protein
MFEAEARELATSVKTVAAVAMVIVMRAFESVVVDST